MAFASEKVGYYLSSQEKDLVDHVKKSIRLAENEISNLNSDVLKIQGMSSPKVRHLLNNLCSAKNTSYLEIGCWKGATWISSLYGNRDKISNAIAVDNWSEFGGPFDQFVSNSLRFLSDHQQYPLYSKDCFSLSLDVFSKPVNVYFYDGDHSAWSQENAFVYYNDVLNSVFVAVVDDWNYEPVQKGTRLAFKNLGYEVLFERILPASYTGDESQWWNGLYVAVVRKPLNERWWGDYQTGQCFTKQND